MRSEKNPRKVKRGLRQATTLSLMSLPGTRDSYAVRRASQNKFHSEGRRTLDSTSPTNQVGYAKALLWILSLPRPVISNGKTGILHR